MIAAQINSSGLRTSSQGGALQGAFSCASIGTDLHYSLI